ncbi:MAG: 2-dehydropantoate 2-reductase [Ancrocorticia sp.]|jgi:2-dehydropantoate 2-reductase|nr:2-dehydropantoate 2-reductase [Ancrocorticia sp.]MCI2002722.1 2-dehydropantoate 2-reductase [Ancrocorticia sp.]MCI2012042.1 2-dehydropantoate 2-reductase [Ancrocorticia sp.]MCI2029438.1 2-dehydropantoate 2-reductase [Ancrocorticia sp.]MCI2178250.1 2-dehydropantoate 2-reductase [Ancrocorticia sp.]
MRIAIIGTGGIGAYYGSRLIADGQEVHFVATPRHVEPVRKRGLIAHTDQHGDATFWPASITTNPRDIGQVDVVVVAVKLYQLDSALEGIAALLKGDTIVFSTQNGVTAPEILARRVGAEHVVPGICYVLAYLEGPGEVTQKGAQPAFTAGPRTIAGTENPLIAEFVAALARQGVAAVVDPTIEHAQWSKFALIATFGGVCGLADATIGEVRDFEPTRELLETSLKEVQELARARGVTLTDDDVAEIMRRFAVQDPSGTTSMQRDIAAGKPSELDFLNGAVASMAHEAGVAVPVNEVAVAVLGLRARRNAVARTTLA